MRERGRRRRGRGWRCATPRSATSCPSSIGDFFAGLPVIFVALAGEQGWPWATALAGPAGFVTSPDPRSLRIARLPARDDPALAGLRPGAAVGLLGIDLATRRRNRANGVVRAVEGDAFSVEIRQSFGNCAQYIQAREPEDRMIAPPGAAERLNGLDEAARTLIAGADTFFVASGNAAEGLDMSHRGGRPGFVRVDGDVLTIPDFRGNRYFNTLGNLLLDPRAGLLFVDFATGELLHLQGRAEVLWACSETQEIAGAERLWRVRLTGGWRRRAALPLRWMFQTYAPTTERTGIWPQRR